MPPPLPSPPPQAVFVLDRVRPLPFISPPPCVAAIDTPTQPALTHTHTHTRNRFDVQAVFRSVDHGHKGHVTKEELKEGLHKAKVRVPPQVSGLHDSVCSTYCKVLQISSVSCFVRPEHAVCILQLAPLG